jgi:hypothetical protein
VPTNAACCAALQDVRQGDVLQCIEVEMVQPDKEAVVSTDGQSLSQK